MPGTHSNSNRVRYNTSVLTCILEPCRQTAERGWMYQKLTPCLSCEFVSGCEFGVFAPWAPPPHNACQGDSAERKG